MNRQEAISAVCQLISNFEANCNERTYTDNGEQKVYRPTPGTIKHNRAQARIAQRVLHYLFNPVDTFPSSVTNEDDEPF